MRTSTSAKTVAGAVLAAGAFFAVPAYADGAWDCNDVSFSGLTYSTCAGSFSPPSPSLSDINTVLGTSFPLYSKDDDKTAGMTAGAIVNGIGTSNGAGTFELTEALGPFALEVKFGNEWSVFLFDGAAADTVYSFSLNQTNLRGLGLSHVAVAYDTLVPSIPEPETYALMMAGLGVMGFIARRRRAA